MDFMGLFDFDGTVDKSDAAVRALQAVQASARKKKHAAFLLRVMSAALETSADDELERTQEAADDITEIETASFDVEFEPEVFAEELED